MEQRVTERLAELEPLVNEYNQLRAEAERFNLSLTRNGTKPAPARPKRSRTPTRRRAKGTTAAQSTKRANDSATASAKPGAASQPSSQAGTSRREQVLELVKSNPGITVAQLGQRLEVDATSLYRHVNRLNADGQIRKSGLELQPA